MRTSLSSVVESLANSVGMHRQQLIVQHLFVVSPSVSSEHGGICLFVVFPHTTVERSHARIEVAAKGIADEVIDGPDMNAVFER